MNILNPFKKQRQRVIIIDGPDKCAKSIIAKALANKLGIPYHKNVGEWKNFGDATDYFVNTLRFAEPFFTTYLKNTKASVIMDRGYPSEFVYSKAFGRQTDERMLEKIDQLYSELNANIVVCHRSSYSGITDDLFPEKITSSKLQEIDSLYTKFEEWTKCKIVHLNVDDEDLDREIRDIVISLEL